jgi:hypothetical protein
MHGNRRHYKPVPGRHIKSGGSMTREPFETDQLLAWLGEALSAAEAVDVDVIVDGQPDSRSSVQITLHGLPGPLGGLEVRPRVADRVRD